MLNPKNILLLLGFFYLVVIFGLLNFSHRPDSHLRLLESQMASEANYEFDDPIAAYLILQKLDEFQDVDIGYTKVKAQKKFTQPLLGLRPDYQYCDKHRAYFVDNPKFIFDQKNFISSYQWSSNLKKYVIPKIGTDVMRHVGFNMPNKFRNEYMFDTRLDVNVFFFFEPAYYMRQLGRQFSCLTQVSNHIPGHENLYRKDFVGQALTEYTKKYEDKPQCFDVNKFFPKTWRMADVDQCLEFFAEFNSPRYFELKQERKIVYFRKIGFGVHQGKGVYPVNDQEEAMVRELYANGTLCGEIDNLFIMQTFIHNPLLINGHKADFRIPMLIASTNPMIVYYNDGFLRISFHEFDPSSDEKGAFLTNLDLSEHAFDIARINGTYNGFTEKELREGAVWSFTRLHKYLMEEGTVKDPQWIDNYLRPQIQKMLVHLIRMSQGPFAKRSSLFEIFGVDVLLDADLNLWFIEANAKPGLEGSSDEARDLFIHFLLDSFDVLFGLLRSRTKRIINYVNLLMRSGEAWKLGDGDAIFMEDLITKRHKFDELTRNYFEPEFEPVFDGKYGFTKIVDENYSGTKRYSEILDKECL